MSGFRDIGEDFTRGVLRELGKWVALVIVIGLVLNWIGWDMDSTDNKATGERSGMKLRVDYASGCQYLEASTGGLTPRLKRSGEQVCA